VPANVTDEVPALALAETVRVRIETPFDPGEIFDVTPLGRPETENEMAPVNPLTGATVRDAVPLLPGAMVSVAGAAEIVKSPAPVDVPWKQDGCPSAKSMSRMGWISRLFDARPVCP